MIYIIRVQNEIFDNIFINYNLRLIIFILIISFITITLCNCFGWFVMNINFCLVPYYFILAPLISSILAIYVFEPLSRYIVGE